MEKMDRRRMVGVVMLHSPPIDKIGALVLLERRTSGEIPVYRFWETNRCTRAQLGSWRAQGIEPIDLGNEKYHQAGMPSAAAYTAKRHGMTVSAGEKALLDILAKNNESGWLKGRPFSTAWILRELYELGYDPQQVVRRVAHVVSCFVRVEDGERVPARDGATMEKIFWCELRRMRNSQFAPMTIPRYLRDMWYLGYQPDKIREMTKWWTHGWNEAKNAHKQAQAAFPRMRRVEFRASTRRCALVHTDDKFVVRVAAQAYDILVVRKSAGQVGILAQKVSLLRLYGWLKAQEPTIWHQAVGAISNGGWMYPRVMGTKLTDEQLIAAVQNNT